MHATLHSLAIPYTTLHLFIYFSNQMIIVHRYLIEQTRKNMYTKQVDK